MPMDKPHFDSWLDGQTNLDAKIIRKTQSDVGRSPAVESGVGSALPKVNPAGGANKVRVGSAEAGGAPKGGMKTKNRPNLHHSVTFKQSQSQSQSQAADQGHYGAILPLTADVLQRVPVEPSPTAHQQPSGSVAVGSHVSRASRASRGSRASRTRSLSHTGRQHDDANERGSAVNASEVGSAKQPRGLSPTMQRLGHSTSVVSGATSACTPAVLPPGATTSVDRRGDIHIHLPNALVGRGLPRFLSAYNPAYDRTPHTEKQDALVDLTSRAEKIDLEHHRKKDWVKNYMEYMSRFGGTLLRGTTMVNQKG